MDFLKKYSKHIIYAFISLFTLGQLICAIILFVDIKDVIDVLDYAGHSRLYLYPAIQYFTSLGITCLSVFGGLLALYRFYANKHNNRIFTVCLNLIALMFLNYIIAGIIGIIMANDYNIDIPGKILGMLIISVLGILALSISCSKGAEKEDKKLIRFGTCAIGAILLLVCGCLIVGNDAKFDKCFGAFSIILPFITFALPIVTGKFELVDGSPKVNLVKGTTVPTATTSQEQKGSSEEAYNALLKLNDLHDRGIISDQEYNEKKSKYIEKL